MFGRYRPEEVPSERMHLKFQYIGLLMKYVRVFPLHGDIFYDVYKQVIEKDGFTPKTARIVVKGKYLKQSDMEYSVKDFVEKWGTDEFALTK